MRHGVRGRKLGRTSAHREALFRNQLQSLMERERIVTTLPKAKELRPLAEKVITRGKHGTVHARRWVLRWIPDRDLVKKVFDDIAPRFSERAGGYLRIVKLGPRKGDGAEMAVIELVDRVAAPAASAKPGKKAKKAKKPARGAARPAAGEAEEMELEAAEEREAAAEAKPAKKTKEPKAAKAGKQAGGEKPAGKPAGKPKKAAEKEEEKPAPKSRFSGLLRRRKKDEET